MGHVAGIQRCQRRAISTLNKVSDKFPLAGIRILDMTRVLAGPYCTQILADLGAEVIKVEHPIRGDDTRAWGSPYAPVTKGSKKGRGESAYYLSVNRNKQSVGLSFQHPKGVEILHKIAAKSDILVENYIPQALKKYRMDFASINAVNPKLIYTSYDVMVEAETGMMHITGFKDGPPVKVGVTVTDLTTGLYAANSILAALLARQRTGTGQHIDVALSDCQVATLANIGSSVLISGEKDSGRWGTAHPSIVPYRGFKTIDGDIMLGGGNDRLFGILCERMERSKWTSDPRFATNSDRVANRDQLEAMIEEVTKTKTTEEWVELFEGSGMAYAAINDVKKTMEHKHVLARNMVTEIEHETCGSIKLINTPVKYSESASGIRSALPTLGEHTDDVLARVVGLSVDEICKLRSDNVVA